MPYAAVQNPVCGHTCGPGEALWYIEPYFDRSYRALARWRRDIVYFYKEKAVRDYEWRHIQPHVWFYIGVGHGTPTTYTGYRLNRIFWVDMTGSGFNPQWLKNTVMLMLSCLTAQRLGPYMVRDIGAWSYLGWAEEFMFAVIIGKRDTWPDRLFFKPIEYSFTNCAMLKMTPKQVYDYLYKTYMKEAEEEERRGHYEVAKWLRWDAKYMRLIGRLDLPPVPRAARVPASLAAAAICPIIGLGLVKLAEKYEKTW